MPPVPIERAAWPFTPPIRSQHCMKEPCISHSAPSGTSVEDTAFEGTASHAINGTAKAPPCTAPQCLASVLVAPQIDINLLIYIGIATSQHSSLPSINRRASAPSWPPGPSKSCLAETFGGGRGNGSLSSGIPLKKLPLEGALRGRRKFVPPNRNPAPSIKRRNFTCLAALGK